VNDRADFANGQAFNIPSAAAHGQLAVVRQLLAAGADPMKADYHRGTALHSAASNGSAPILNVLLAAGCDPDAECD